MIRITRDDMVEARADASELAWFDDHFPDEMTSFRNPEELLLFGHDQHWPNFREWLSRFGLNRPFSNTDLRFAVLRGADLAGADLAFADLRGANLIEANLVGARFFYTQLEGANLNGADIRAATFDHVDFSRAQLHGARRRDGIDTILPYWKVDRERLVYVSPSDSDEED